MPRSRSASELAAGKLVSAIQKVWAEHAGSDEGYEAELVMTRAESLLYAIRSGNIGSVLGEASVRDFVGANWILRHASTELAVMELEVALKQSE